jgi:protein phosphatase
MREAILKANARILEVAECQPSLRGMGTTLTALRLDADTGVFEIGHVGDSRAYRLNEGTLWKLTRDHTAAEAMVEQGALSPQQARNHAMSHLLSRALGTQELVDVEVLLGTAESGDRFLLCSDGLVRVFEDWELEERLRECRRGKVEEVVTSLIEEANQRGAPDNVTVAILAVD